MFTGLSCTFQDKVGDIPLLTEEEASKYKNENTSTLLSDMNTERNLIESSEKYQCDQIKLTFLLGNHKRTGEHSSVRTLFNNPLSDRQAIKMVLDMMDGDSELQPNQSSTEAARLG